MLVPRPEPADLTLPTLEGQEPPHLTLSRTNGNIVARP